MIDTIFTTYKTLNWFIAMCFLGAGQPIKSFAIFIPVTLILLPFLINHDFFKEKKIKDLKIKLRLASMPLIWMIIGLLGIALEGYHNAGFIVSLLSLGYIIFGIYQIRKNENYKEITVIYFIINGYMVLMMSFIAGMAISETWL